MIAFQSNRDGNVEIYVMNADGSGLTRLTNSPGADAAPDWSPDGRKLVFQSERDGNIELYTMNADGNGQTRLTTHPGRDLDPAWSPTGLWITFDRDVEPVADQVRQVHTDPARRATCSRSSRTSPVRTRTPAGVPCSVCVICP